MGLFCFVLDFQGKRTMDDDATVQTSIRYSAGLGRCFRYGES
jgi:hypothetical protein